MRGVAKIKKMFEDGNIGVCFLCSFCSWLNVFHIFNQ